MQVEISISSDEATITSTNDSEHKKGSKHYENDACDIRGNEVKDDVQKKIADELKTELGDDFGVVDEYFKDSPANDHIHIEYDPKK